MEDDLKKNKKWKTTSEKKMEDDLKKNWKTTSKNRKYLNLQQTMWGNQKKDILLFDNVMYLI